MIWYFSQTGKRNLWNVSLKILYQVNLRPSISDALAADVNAKARSILMLNAWVRDPYHNLKLAKKSKTFTIYHIKLNSGCAGFLLKMPERKAKIISFSRIGIPRIGSWQVEIADPYPARAVYL